MKPIVIDSSMAMAWCLKDERQDAVVTLLDLLSGRKLIAPPIWLYEVGNVLAIAKRKGRVSEDDVKTAFRYLVNLRVEIDISPAHLLDAEALHAKAVEHDLTTYDAAYLHCAERHAADLATLDLKLSAAARKVGMTVLVSA